jgi:hypothetical protein
MAKLHRSETGKFLCIAGCIRFKIGPQKDETALSSEVYSH